MYPLLRLTSAMVVLASTAGLANDQSDCFQQSDPQLRLKSCSQLIQHDQRDATAYQNRAVAYGLLGDLDHAIADYTKAIEIKPNNAAAYESRGRAYASKGDYTSAIADAQKASELAASEMKAIAPKAPKPGFVAPAQNKSAAAKSPKARVSQGGAVAKPASEDGWSDWAASLRDKSAD
jgi:tetratricopeptide (TPR) repeat protein